MRPNTTWLWNNTQVDGENSGNAGGGAGAGGSNWVVMDLVNDRFTFLDDQNVDGDLVSAVRYPVIIPGAGSIEAPKTFAVDQSEGVLDQIPLAGSSGGGQDGGNTRFVFAIFFDGPTAGIPYLEGWDSSAHATVNNAFLGAGTPSASTIKGIATTNGPPGSASWAGTPLAGSTSRLSLDAAALAGAKNLYFNLRLVLPSTFAPQTYDNAVLTLRFVYS